MQKKFLEADVPNKNGRIYPRALLEKIVAEHSSTEVYGMLGMPSGDLIAAIDIEKMSHVISNIRIVDNFLVGEIKTLESRPGLILRQLLDVDEVAFRTAGAASFEEDGKTVKEFKLISINAISKETAA